jgi:ubiquinol-cytochrome c reductase cytochrome c1 subunit
MKKLLSILFLAVLPAAVLASESEGPTLDPVKIDLSDKASLQRGARVFMNYCLSCHSAAYMRYNRVAADLGIPEKLMTENMLFIPDAKGEFKIGSLMKANLSVEDAKATFNTMPPDLTLVTRSRGPEWFYTYMRSFYQDDTTPSGWNNTVFPHVAMPHVLYGLQGTQRAVFKTVKLTVHGDDGKPKEVDEEKFDQFELDKPGSLSAKQYDDSMRDLTNFMVYLGEPAKLERPRIGIFVLLFLAVFLVVAYLLEKEYWKDVH